MTPSAPYDIFLAPGKRTPFVKAGGSYAAHNAIEVSIPVVQAMGEQGRPDFMVWGQVIPSTTVSNLARELLLEAGLDPEIPAFTTVLACSTSMAATIQAAGMLGRGGTELALVGGVETMSHVPIGLTETAAQKIAFLALSDPGAALEAVETLKADDFHLPITGWANRISGRSMGQHTEDTAKLFEIPREQQDQVALASHRNATAAQDKGFFDDLLVPFAGVERDAMPRRDTSAERLAGLRPVFDAESGMGTLTAGNSSPLTDGAAGLWVATRQGLERLGAPAEVRIVDWALAAMDYKTEGILMAPARAIPRLLSRHGLRFEDIALWEIHEAFAAQLLANVKAITDADYRRTRAGVDADLGDFPWDRLNPHGGSLAIGHPFGGTGARILSQATKELSTLTSGSRAVVSICADGGQGSVMLLERV